MKRTQAGPILGRALTTPGRALQKEPCRAEGDRAASGVAPAGPEKGGDQRVLVEELDLPGGGQDPQPACGCWTQISRVRCRSSDRRSPGRYATRSTRSRSRALVAERSGGPGGRRQVQLAVRGPRPGVRRHRSRSDLRPPPLIPCRGQRDGGKPSDFRHRLTTVVPGSGRRVPALQALVLVRHVDHHRLATVIPGGGRRVPALQALVLVRHLDHLLVSYDDPPSCRCLRWSRRLSLC
jgi:hypothetical protein